jgi:hypothetical protein
LLASSGGVSIGAQIDGVNLPPGPLERKPASRGDCGMSPVSNHQKIRHCNAVLGCCNLSLSTMIINDYLVFVHQPKTGGHFVREVLHHASQREIREFPLGYFRRAGFLPRHLRDKEVGDYHATCRDIPPEHRHKPVLSAVRDPFDYYVSLYHYGWWASHPEVYRDVDEVQRAFPNFPKLSFEEFLDLANRFFRAFDEIGDETENHKFGFYSTTFVQSFFRNPNQAYQSIDADYLSRRRWQSDMFPVHFLSTERLNDDLYAFLRRAGYPRRYIVKVGTKLPVRPTTGMFELQSKASYKSHYSEAAYEFVRHKERLLFAIFDHLDANKPYSTWRQ